MAGGDDRQVLLELLHEALLQGVQAHRDTSSNG